MLFTRFVIKHFNEFQIYQSVFCMIFSWLNNDYLSLSKNCSNGAASLSESNNFPPGAICISSSLQDKFLLSLESNDCVLVFFQISYITLKMSITVTISHNQLFIHRVECRSCFTTVIHILVLIVHTPKLSLKQSQIPQLQLGPSSTS